MENRRCNWKGLKKWGDHKIFFRMHSSHLTKASVKNCKYIYIYIIIYMYNHPEKEKTSKQNNWTIITIHFSKANCFFQRVFVYSCFLWWFLERTSWFLMPGSMWDKTKIYLGFKMLNFQTGETWRVAFTRDPMAMVVKVMDPRATRKDRIYPWLR